MPDALRLRAGRGAFRAAAGSWLTVDVQTLQAQAKPSLYGATTRPGSPPLAMQRTPSGGLSHGLSSDLAWQPQRLSGPRGSPGSTPGGNGAGSSGAGGLLPPGSPPGLQPPPDVTATEWPSVLSRLTVEVPAACVVPDLQQPFAAYRIRVRLGPPRWAKPAAEAAAADPSGGGSSSSSFGRLFGRSTSTSGGSWESAPFGTPLSPREAADGGVSSGGRLSGLAAAGLAAVPPVR